MKYFNTPQGVFAIEPDGSQDYAIKPEWVAMSPQEIEAHCNPPPTPQETLARMTASVQQRLDAFAQTRGYDGILSACTYAASAVPTFKAEGLRCVALRDATWAAAAAIAAAVQAEKRQAPSEADLLSELPDLTWG